MNDQTHDDTGTGRCTAGTPFSFELYPPRSDAAAARLPHTIDRLAAASPDFISVTYGAGGSSRSSSLDVIRYIRQNTSVDPMAHLTCIGSSHAQANRLIREFLEAGVRSFLALRGDPPDGNAEGEHALGDLPGGDLPGGDLPGGDLPGGDLPGGDLPGGDLHSAAELVQLIHRVQAERVPYSEVSVPGLPGLRTVRSRRERVTIAVAAFPNGHPRSRSASQDIDTLLAKQAAGANLAITQLFFHADDYLAFAQRAKQAGVDFPILPGIMPVTSPARLRRMLELSGEDMPSELAIQLEIEPTEQGQREIGIEHAARFAERLIAGGAPGIHLYTFNQHDTVLAVLERCGILTTSTEKEPA